MSYKLNPLLTSNFEGTKRIASSRMMCDRCKNPITKMAHYFTTATECVKEMSQNRRANCCLNCMKFLLANPKISIGVMQWKESEP